MKGNRKAGIKAAVLCAMYLVMLLLPAAQAQAEASAPMGETGPQRIVVFPLFAEEILYGLVEPERISYVGHRYAAEGEGYWPTMALSKAAAGNSYPNTSAERLLAIQPDLVIVRAEDKPYFEEIYPELRQVPTLYVSSPGSVAELRALILSIGDAVGEEKKAQRMVEELDSTLAYLSELIGSLPGREPKTVAMVNWDRRDEACFRIVAGLCGVEGIFCTDAVDLHDVCQHDVCPDVILYPAHIYDEGEFLLAIGEEYCGRERSRIEAKLARAGFAACSQDDIHEIHLTGSQYIAAAALRTAELVYPELSPHIAAFREEQQAADP